MLVLLLLAALGLSRAGQLHQTLHGHFSPGASSELHAACAHSHSHESNAPERDAGSDHPDDHECVLNLMARGQVEFGGPPLEAPAPIAAAGRLELTDLIFCFPPAFLDFRGRAPPANG